MRRRSGFTLIELLVVVAIIALLIAILLPSLGKAKEQAYTARCAANMKGIALAIITYETDNNGMLPPTRVSAGGATIYPNGWFWATELVKQGYLKSGNDWNGTSLNPSSRSSFFCPDCLLQKSSGTAQSPQDPILKGYGQFSTGSSGGTDQVGDTDILTWYMPNSHNLSTGNDPGRFNGTSSGGATPFMDWNATGDTVEATGTGNLVSNTAYRRTFAMVSQQSRFVMLVESYNTTNDTPGTAPAEKLNRIRGCHGDSTNGGLDGSTNFAFFDGHVSKFPTAPIELNGIFLTNPMRSISQDYLTYLQEQY